MKMMSWLQSNKQGALALAIMLGIVLLVVFLASIPLFERSERYRLELVKDGRQVQQLLALSASREELENSYGEFRSKGLDQWVYQGRDAEAIELNIQRQVTEILSGQGVQVRTVSSIRGRQRENYQVVGVQFSFSGNLTGVMHVFEAIGSIRPLLLVEDLRVAPTGVGYSSEGAPKQSLEVEMSVITFLPLAGSADEQEGV